jgi:hypothetical protein
MSRIGRNPFEAKKTSAPVKPLRALDIMRDAEKAEESSHTEKKTRKAGICNRLIEFLMVDVRAESYVFGLKAYLLSLSLFE